VNDSAITTQDFALTTATTSACSVDTSQADFLTGIMTNVDLSASPGDITITKPSLDQQNTTVGTNGVGITIATYGGQTFTPALTGNLKKVDINLFCSGCTGTTPNLTLSLRNTITGLPTGADLASATISGFSGGGAASFFTATFASPPTLTAGTQYALVIRPITNPSPGTYALTRSGTSTLGANVYAGGTRVAGTSSGTVWSIPLTGGVNTDTGFRIYLDTFAPSASLSSGTRDANPAVGLGAHWTTLSWTAATPANTTIQFQAAVSNNINGPFNFVGPDGTAGSFFTTSGASLAQFDGFRYLKYKALLSTTDSTMTPILSDVTVCFADAAPTITAATLLARQQGSASAAQIASVNDSAQTANPLTVTAAPLSGSGVTITNISINASGAVIADVAASCMATNATFRLTVTDNANATASAILPVNVTSIATPTITPGDPTSFCEGGSVTLTSSSASGYQWFLNGNPIGGATNQNYVATAAGKYTVTVTTTGCPSAPSAATIVNADTPPDLVYPTPQSLGLGGPLSVTPTTAGDNGSITGYTVVSVVPALTTAPTVSSNGVVSIANAQPAGSHVITIRATDNCSATKDASFTLDVSKAVSTMSLTSSANPSDVGQSVTFTATLTSVVGTPTGTVQFKVDNVSAGPAVALNGSGVASFTTTTLTAGTRAITADYDGDANFLTNTSTLSGGEIVKAQPSLSINDVSITEGDSGTKTLNFTITLSATSSLSVTANFATANSTATAPADYTAIGTTILTFDPGDVTKTIGVTINGDTSFEPDETFIVNLFGPVNATISKAQGTGTILNDDGQGGVVSFSSATYSVSKSAGFLLVTVNRSGDAATAASVDYATSDDSASAMIPCSTSDGLATSRCNFTSTFGTLKFAATETVKTFIVPITQDSYVGPPETFGLTLSNLTGGAVFATPSNANVTITDGTNVLPPNAIDDTGAFVRQQYHDFLNREADIAGLSFWKDQIDGCTPKPQCIEIQRISVSAAFFLSIEFNQSGGLVRDFYVASLDRLNPYNMPGFVEFERDTQTVQRGVIVGQGTWQADLDANRLAFMNDFVTRTEFVGLYPTTDTPNQYVNKLFAHAGITPAAAEQSAAAGEFGSAANAADPAARGRALLRVTQNSAFQQREFNRAFVQMQYFGYLRRDPNASPDANFAGYDSWVNKLNQFNGNFIHADMVKGFINSGEYRGRFGP
jgi:hypothetical protein